MLFLVLLGVFLAPAAGQSSSGVSFVSIGDWGGASIDEMRKQSEESVAESFGRVSTNISANFILNTGDNFYYYGVKSVKDPLWETNFEKIYSQPSLMKKWYSVLGNHDYGFNPGAQVQYKSPNNDRWVLPSRYYSRRIKLGDTSSYATLIMLDTNPCISKYRSDDPVGWDPCGTDIPGPAPTDCKFHENIVKQNCTSQYFWLKETMQQIPKDDWVIAVGHHPLDEIDVLDFVSLLQDANMHLYLNGHTHAMAYYMVNGLSCVTSGGGCMVNLDEETKDHELGSKDLQKGRDLKTMHSYKEVWNKKSAGFTTHTFSSDMNVLTTTIMDGFGRPIYEFFVKKK